MKNETSNGITEREREGARERERDHYLFGIHHFRSIVFVKWKGGGDWGEGWIYASKIT
jgi:hypothetical protein